MSTPAARRRQYAWAAVGGVAAAYIVYRSLQKRQSQWAKLKETLGNYATALAAASGTCSLIATDLLTFLNSDADELPQSIKQLSKLAQSQEVQGPLKDVVATVVRAAAEATAPAPGAAAATPVIDKVLDALFSERGQGLLGAAVGLATRNATEAFCQYLERSQGSADPATAFTPATVLTWLASPQGERVLSLLVSQSVGTAIHSYVDAYSGYNMYDDMLASLSNPAHRTALNEVLTSCISTFCRDGVREVSAAMRRQQQASNRAPGQHAGQQGVSNSQRSGGAGAAGGGTSHDPAAGGSSHLQTSTSSSSSSHQALASLAGAGSAPPGSTSSGPCSSSSNSALVAAGKLNQPWAPSRVSLVGGASGGGVPASAPAPAGWLRTIADLAKEREARSFVLDMATSATRASAHEFAAEARHTVVELVNRLVVGGHASGRAGAPGARSARLHQQQEGSGSSSAAAAAAGSLGDAAEVEWEGEEGCDAAPVVRLSPATVAALRMRGYIMMSLCVSMLAYLLSPRTLVV